MAENKRRIRDSTDVRKTAKGGNIIEGMAVEKWKTLRSVQDGKAKDMTEEYSERQMSCTTTFTFTGSVISRSKHIKG